MSPAAAANDAIYGQLSLVDELLARRRRPASGNCAAGELGKGNTLMINLEVNELGGSIRPGVQLGGNISRIGDSKKVSQAWKTRLFGITARPSPTLPHVPFCCRCSLPSPWPPLLLALASPLWPGRPDAPDQVSARWGSGVSGQET